MKWVNPRSAIHELSQVRSKSTDVLDMLIIVNDYQQPYYEVSGSRILNQTAKPSQAASSAESSRITDPK